MDIDRVRYFHVFADTGSLVKASEVLHISQPALSKALKLLEQELNAKLVEPDGRGLRLTTAGETFKKETSALLQQWLQVPKKLGTSLTAVPTKIGSFEVFTTYFLAHLTKYIDLGALELHEYQPGKLEEAVANGTIDVGITYLPIPKSQIEFIEINEIQMGIFGLKKFRDFVLTDLPFAVPLHPAEGTPSRVVGLDGWPDHKHQRTIKFQVTMMESALELCRLGLAVAYLPKFVVELHNENVLPQLRLVEYPSPMKLKNRKQSVFLIQRKQAHESNLHRQISKCLRSLA